MTPQRELFWGIEHAWLFYVLAAISLCVFAYGAATHVTRWARGDRDLRLRLSGRGLGDLVLDGLLGRRIFRGDLAAGTMHALILWGFLGLMVGTTLDAVDHYLVSFLSGDTYLVFSAYVDASGVILLVGVCWALVRRYVRRVPRLQNRGGDLLLLLWLLVAALTGFLVEGLRLAIQSPPWAGWSFAGLVVSGLWPSPPDAAVYALFWWLHAVVSLVFIAAVPYSKLLHALVAPVNVYISGEPQLALPAESRQEGAGLTLRQRVALDSCTRCGRCVEACPSAGAGEALSPRQYLLDVKAANGPADPGEGAPEQKTVQGTWHCTTCRACREVCPVYIETPDISREVRRQLVEDGTEVPAHLSQTLERLYKYANPWEASKKKRGKLSRELKIPDLSKKGAGEGQLCYFVGCTTAMDTRAQQLARSLVQVLSRAGVSFGTLGKKEPCCGEIARRLGEDGLFEDQMERGLKQFSRRKVQDVVTSSPHCFHTMHNDYRRFEELEPEDQRGAPRVRHYVHLLDELVLAGSLPLCRLEARVTYHDPCYLGRHNGIYEAPRRVIRAIEGVELVEMAHHAEGSLCCGGGGGRMWQEELDAEQKMSEVRIREAEATGAKMVITACPLCLIMLDDARKTAGLEDTLKVVDLNELVVMALDDDAGAEDEPGSRGPRPLKTTSEVRP